MAKSNKRRKQDQAKAAHKRAEQARRKERHELTRQAALAMQQVLDPQTPPAEVAALITHALPDVVYLAAHVAQRRIEKGAEPQDMAEAGRLLLAAYPEQPPAGALAFAVCAAHADGQEEDEHRLAAQLLDAARAADDDTWLDVIDYVIATWHPDEAAELLEPYLVDHPAHHRAHRVYALALSAAYQNSDEAQRANRGLFTRFAERTALAVTREALEEFLQRTPWGDRVRALAAEHLETAGGKDLPEEERSGLTSVAFELALLGAEDADDDLPLDDLIQRSGEERHHQTLLEAFAADPQTPGELARRALDWHEHAVYGLWQMDSPAADPGVWVRDLVTGASWYAQFPPGALAGAPPWTTWFGCLLPVDGVWRSTGTGLRLSPAEADAIGEYADAAVRILAVSLAEGPDADLPARPPIRFGQAGPYAVTSEFDEALGEEYAAFVSKVVAAVLPESVVEVLRYRATPPRLRSTGRDKMGLKRLPRALTRLDAASEAQAKAWLDEPVPALQDLTPREAAASDDPVDVFRLESLLRQLEYEAGPAEAAGQERTNLALLRAELNIEEALDSIE